MSATGTWLDVAVLVTAGTAVIANAVAFVVNLGRLDGSPWYVVLGTAQAGLVVMMWLQARRAWRRIQVARVAAQMRVRIVRGDVVLRPRLCYGGLDEQGCHTWVIVDPELLPTDQLQVGMMPPWTAIVWTCASSWEGKRWTA